MKHIKKNVESKLKNKEYILENKKSNLENKEIKSEEHKKYLKNLLDRIDSLNDMYE